MHVFVTHTRRDLPTITRLRSDLENIGHRVWSDCDAGGARRAWDDVLEHVRGCLLFVFAVSPETVRSPACLTELRYAQALRRPVLAVTVRPVRGDEVPDELTGVGTVDYAAPTAQTAIALRKAVNATPAARPLPARLPEEPAIPTSTITDCEALLDGPELDPRTQSEVLARLRSRLADPDERAEVWRLLVRLRQREELVPRVASGVEHVLAPGWQPDPRDHYEARYWDGQAWTTLVWQNGREFTDRGRPPEVPVPPRRPEVRVSAAPAKPVAVLAPRRGPAPKEQEEPPRRGRRPLVLAGVLVLAAGVTGGVLLFRGFGPDQVSANRTARNFVDAVNTHDQRTVTEYVCARDRTTNAHLYGAFFDRADVTLESVNASGTDPRFTILAARTAGTSSMRLSIPLEVENGEWRVCDIGKALSGR